MKATTQKATKREKLPPLAALPPGDLAITEAEAEVLRAVLLPKLQALAEHEAAIQKRGGKAPFELTGETKGFDINGLVITEWTAKDGVKVVHKVVDVAERTQPDYTNDTMGDAALACKPAAEHFGLPVEFVAETLERAKAELLAREATTRATTTPRLKWETDRKPDEDPAHFAARAGYVHRGLIHDQDRALSVKLSNWLRTHKGPEDVPYIPTKPEWITRQIQAGKAQQAPRPRTEQQRLYGAAVNRRYRARHATP